MTFQDQSNEWIERVAAIQETIALPGGAAYVTTIQSAEPYMPSDMSSAKCPFFINEVKDGPTNFLATGGLQWVETNVNMVLCVLRREQNTDLRLGIKQTLYWRNAVFSTFAAHLQLGSGPVNGTFPRLPYILEAPITKWAAPFEPYTYGAAQFITLQFNLRVREAFVLTIGG